MMQRLMHAANILTIQTRRHRLNTFALAGNNKPLQ
jgi:hypothetical protein